MNKTQETCSIKLKCILYEEGPAYVDVSRKFALIGNFLNIVDRGRKRASVAVCEHGRLLATGYFISATSCMRS